MAVQSKILPPSFFNRDRQILTRYQERRIRQTFPFLDLPAELRNIMYELCIDFYGIETYFDRCYKVMDNAWSPNQANSSKAPPTFKKTPEMFLICRQIFSEAVMFLAKKGVAFHHGLLSLSRINDVMSENVVRNISSITVTTKGHPTLKKKILAPSWRGYMDLIADLAYVLESGHKLKTFTIAFDDEDLKFHLYNCWYAGFECDFRDHIKDALGRLRNVRGISQVTIRGIDRDFAASLKARMESKPMSFLLLPAELRNRIYSLSADYSDISPRLARILQSCSNHKDEFPYPVLTTPTILLLNRQIHQEAIHILYKKTLNIALPVDHHIQNQSQVPEPLRFISATTLQKITRLSITIGSWEWIFAVEKILKVLKQKHSLEYFRFNFRDDLKISFQHPGRRYPDRSLATCLVDLGEIRGVEDVVFEGDLPDVYTQAMAATMRSQAGTVGLPKLQALRSDGVAVDVELEPR